MARSPAALNGPKPDVVTTYFVAARRFCVILVVEGLLICGRDAMFLKRLVRRKSGKKHTYWALVESIRTARGSRHRVVAYLGELEKSERNGWAQLCRRLNKEQRPEPSLFDPPHYDDPEDDEPILVKLKGIRLQRLRDFGDVWLALGLWRLLGLDTLLDRLMPVGQEDVPWATVAAILTIARFCEPSSELHIADTWYRRTALEDLLGVSVEQVHHRRLYAGLDQLLPYKEWAFRISKDELKIRPIWHQKAERVLAHILVCFLAYVLWKALARWMRGAGLGDAPRTLVEEFAKIKSGDVVLPAQWADGTERIVHLRCVTTPDDAQKVLLNRLGLTLPLRLRRIDEVAQM